MQRNVEEYLSALHREMLSAIEGTQATVPQALALEAKAISFMRSLYRAYEDRLELAAWQVTQLEPEQIVQPE